MVADTLHVMAKKHDDKTNLKRKSISMRIDAALLDRLDRFCSSQDIPLDRTAFIEVAIRRLLDKKTEDEEDA